MVQNTLKEPTRGGLVQNQNHKYKTQLTNKTKLKIYLFKDEFGSYKPITVDLYLEI